jgi:hypothetical protein
MTAAEWLAELESRLSTVGRALEAVAAIARKVQQAADSGFRGGHLKGPRPGINAEIGGPLLG